MKLGHVTESPRGYRRTHVTGSEKKAASVSSSPLLPSSCGCILKWETIKKKKQVSEYSVPLVIFLNIILFVFHFLFNLSVCVSLPLSSPSVQLNSNIHHWHGCHYYVAKAIKYITIWDCVCVCVLGVCTCISHQSWSSLPNPFPESTTDSFEVNLESAV